MKNLATFGLAVLALAACSSDDTDTRSAARTELRLSSGIEVMTRGDVQSTQIVEGETVHAWVIDAGAGVAVPNLYNALSLTVGDNGALSSTAPIYFPQTGNNVNLRALHGTFAANAFTAEGGEAVAFPRNVAFSVAADQRTTDAYVESDLLYAAADGVSRNGNPTTVNLSFYHMLSKLELKIVAGAGVEDGVTSVSLGGVALSGTFTPAATAAELTDATNGAANRAAMIAPDATSTSSMSLGTAYVGDDSNNPVSNDAILVPQTMAGKTLSFTLESGGSLVYTFPSDKVFESGKKYIYTVTLNQTALEVVSEVVNWDATVEENGSAGQPDNSPQP